MSKQDIAAAALFFSSLRVGNESGVQEDGALSENESESSKRNRASDVGMEDTESEQRSKKMSRKQKRKEAAVQLPAFPAEPTVVHVVTKKRGFVNHSYKDFSLVPATLDYEGEPLGINEMSFLQKLHQLLTLSQTDEQLAVWISWMPHGRSFRINVPKRLEQSGMFQSYFKYTRFGAFITQLISNGFKHISQGEDRNCYYHEVRVLLFSILYLAFTHFTPI